MQARNTLCNFARPLVMGLPQTPCHCKERQGKEEHLIFSAENLPKAPPLLAASNLVMAKTEHGYGNCHRVDVIHFYASGQTYRELAILILAGLFSGTAKRAALILDHPASAIKRLEINYSHHSSSSCWEYTRNPKQFTYHPEIPERVPWSWHLDERDLPFFDLDFSKGARFHPVTDRDKRDRVVISGNDAALVLAADLLLNIGLPACDVSPSGHLDKEYILECCLGRQRVSKWSAEAQFHLPYGLSWPGEHPILEKD